MSYLTGYYMKLRQSIRLILAIVYLLLVAISLIVLLINSEKSPFAGVYLTILTLPWSIVLAFISSLWSLIAGKESFVINIFLSIIFALLNTYLIYKPKIKR